MIPDTDDAVSQCYEETGSGVQVLYTVEMKASFNMGEGSGHKAPVS